MTIVPEPAAVLTASGPGRLALDGGVPIRDRCSPVAARLGATSLAFPVHPTLSPDNLRDIADAITKVPAVAAPAT